MARRDRRRLSVCTLIGVTLVALSAPAVAENHFIEAESFSLPTRGWTIHRGLGVRTASERQTLRGTTKPSSGAAVRRIRIRKAGRYRVWIRLSWLSRKLAPVQLELRQGKRRRARHLFAGAPHGDAAPRPPKQPRPFSLMWDHLDVKLTAGPLTLLLSRPPGRLTAKQALVQQVDCLLLSDDPNRRPGSSPNRPRTFLRYRPTQPLTRAVWLHISADHYRPPWHTRRSLGRRGIVAGGSVPPNDRFRPGETFGWWDITDLLLEDSGAKLHFSLRRAPGHTVVTPLAGTIELASAPNAGEVTATLPVTSDRGLVVLMMPPDLSTAEQRKRLRTDRQLAWQLGIRADTTAWPISGRRPKQFPMLLRTDLTQRLHNVDSSVRKRELQTLDYFGFSSDTHHSLVVNLVPYYRNGCYLQSDRRRMDRRLRQRLKQWRDAGGKLARLVYCWVADEPRTTTAKHLASCPVCGEAFRRWLRQQDLDPGELGQTDWSQVRPVTAEARQTSPALHYQTQRFRSVTMARHIGTMTRSVEAVTGRRVPAMVTFVDWALTRGSFYPAVDYFELARGGEIKGLAGSNWATTVSSPRAALFHLDLLSAAARSRQLPLLWMLIGHATRGPWDLKLNTVGTLSRPLSVLDNFIYGPAWSTHEGGPWWRSMLWGLVPETWRAVAESVRAVGWVDDLLRQRRTATGEVALIYSSSSDIWLGGADRSVGFDRIHSWLALRQAQLSVDILSERQLEHGALRRYRLAYLVGPNLTRAAARALGSWVLGGGHLWRAVGAGARDEYNRPQDPSLLSTMAHPGQPVRRRPWIGPASRLANARPLDRVRLTADSDPRGSAGPWLPVLGLKGSVPLRADGQLLGRFADGTPALVRHPVGAGAVIDAGFLLGLAHVQPALRHRRQLAGARGPRLGRAETWTRVAETELHLRSRNPWRYPVSTVAALAAAARQAGVVPSLRCDVPGVALARKPARGEALLTLTNHTLQPQPRVTVTVRDRRPIRRLESLYQGPLRFARHPGGVRFTLPLSATDIVRITY